VLVRCPRATACDGRGIAVCSAQTGRQR